MLCNWEPLNAEAIKNLLYEMIYLKTWDIDDPKLFEDVIDFCTKNYSICQEDPKVREEYNALWDRMDDAWKDMYYG